MNDLYRRSISLLMVVVIALGFGLLFQTARHGGGTAGFAVGALFIVLGTARLYLLRKR
jgi:hypothetical protein